MRRRTATGGHRCGWKGPGAASAARPRLPPCRIGWPPASRTAVRRPAVPPLPGRRRATARRHPRAPVPLHVPPVSSRVRRAPDRTAGRVQAQRAWRTPGRNVAASRLWPGNAESLAPPIPRHRRAADRSADRRREPQPHRLPSRAAGQGMSAHRRPGTGAASRHTPTSWRAIATQRLRGSTLQSACAAMVAQCRCNDGSARIPVAPSCME